LKDFEETYSLSKKILRLTNKAVRDYNMILPGDSVMIGLSGGKDSLVLSLALAYFRKRNPVKFKLAACLIDHSNGKMEVARIKSFMNELNIPLEIILRPTYKIIEERNERFPCGLCANLRRGILADKANEMDCNVVVLGHNKDDAAETVLLNLFYSGRFKCFHPNLYMTRTKVRVIRPLIHVEENSIDSEAKRLALPIYKTCCPYEDKSKRKSTKELIAQLEKQAPDLKSNIIHALKSVKDDDIWK